MTRERAHSRARGALFFAGFGAVWMATGLSQTHHSSAVTTLLLVAVSIVLLACAGHLMRRARDLRAGQTSLEEQVRAERMFTAVNIIQWVSIGTAVVILGLLHMPEYVVPAISLLVALHLFPLAGSFHDRQHYVTGALLLLWPLLCLALLPRARVSGACALGAGVILLLSAGAMLARAFAAIRPEQPQSAIARA